MYLAYSLSYLHSIQIFDLLAIFIEIMTFNGYLTFDLLDWPWTKGHRSNLMPDLEYLCQISNKTIMHPNSPSLIFKALFNILYKFDLWPY